MPPHFYYTYIVASRSRTLYIGMTGNLEQRIWQHKNKEYEGFSAAYNCVRLVWFERYATPATAIAREKQLKGWIRAKKIALIETSNPTWFDLSGDWGKPISAPSKAYVRQNKKQAGGPFRPGFGLSGHDARTLAITHPDSLHDAEEQRFITLGIRTRFHRICRPHLGRR